MSRNTIIVHFHQINRYFHLSLSSQVSHYSYVIPTICSPLLLLTYLQPPSHFPDLMSNANNTLNIRFEYFYLPFQCVSSPLYVCCRQLHLEELHPFRSSHDQQQYDKDSSSNPPMLFPHPLYVVSIQPIGRQTIFHCSQEIYQITTISSEMPSFCLPKVIFPRVLPGTTVAWLLSLAMRCRATPWETNNGTVAQLMKLTTLRSRFY